MRAERTLIWGTRIGTMLTSLHTVIEHDLVRLMKEPDRWNSVEVTYHAPRVERLWTQLGELRIFLHRIYPCAQGDALFHPHPWPSAVRVVSGKYEHQSAELDMSSPKPFPAYGPVVCRAILCAGAEYEMTDPRGWHSVRPLDSPSDSIMVVGAKYPPGAVYMPSPPTEKQGPLSPERFIELFNEWHDRINHQVRCGTCGWEGRYHDLASYEGESPFARCPKCWDEDQVCTKR